MKTKITFLILLIALIFTGNKTLFSQWVQMSNGIASNSSIYSLATGANSILAGTYTSGIFRTTNSGSNWTAVNNGITHMTVWELAPIGTNIFAGTFYGGAFLSTNNGNNWIAINSGMTNAAPRGFISHNGYIFAATWGGGVFRTTNNGTNWVSVNSGPISNSAAWGIASTGTYLFVATQGNGVFRTTNNGANWTQVNSGLTNILTYRLAVIGTNVFVGTDGSGVFRSTNYGNNWTQTGLNNLTIYSMLVIGSNLFAGTSNSGIYKSTNNGANWTQINQGLTNGLVLSLASDNVYLYAGTGGANVFRRSIAEITAIEPVETGTPNHFFLSQNYPNPFNPATTINYELPITNYVRIVVYDILGKEVTVLVDEKQTSGSYNVTWDASNYPSGVYYYKLETDEFTETKKMILIK